MKFFMNVYDNFIFRPSNKYSINLFFLKNNLYFYIKNINYIHIFLKFKKIFNIKIFKFNYNVYLNFISYFILLNILMQLFLTIIIL